MSSVVVVSNLPVEGTFASGSGGGASDTPIANRRAKAAYNSSNLTGPDRISLMAAQRRGETYANWARRRGIPGAR